MHQIWYAVMHSHGTCYGMQGAIRLDVRAMVCHKLFLDLMSWGCGHQHVVHTGHHHLLSQRVLEVEHVLLVGLSPVTELVASLVLATASIS